jgi:spermidine/putrescine transport system ATP-binding protein
MRNVELKQVTKSYRGETIIENINLTIPSGKFFALLGPSGSGKTTILRLIGGFEQVDSGRILIGGRDVTHLPSNQRSVNTVFQSYALFTHLDVFENVAYSLRVRGGVDEVAIKNRVMQLLKTFGLEKHIYKTVTELSGGQQQRVALARAIINEPAVLLLDEPLAAMDYRLREKMLVELIELQDSLKTTFVYVTHDPFEALTVADQMAIMNSDGEIEQVGTPKEIYEFPVSSFVAKFVGPANILRGTLEFVDDVAHVMVPDLGVFPVDVARHKDEKAQWLVPGRKALLSIRPEKIFITKRSLEGFTTKLSGTVETIVYSGRSTEYNVRISPTCVLRVFEQNEEHIAQEVIDYDDKVYLYWQQKNVVVLER